jgi:16S rRNA (cytosine1402-N4)-methyltransferase
MSAHVPVMLDDVMAILAPRDDAIYVDATFGGGGYTAALLSRARCTVYAIDRDEDAIARGRVLADRFGGRLTLMHGRFSEMEALLAGHGVNKADGVAFDIGVSSFQFDDAERGFSFSHDGPLDMRMDPSRDDSAADLVNTLSQSELASILRDFGEEKRAQAVARAIVAARPITRTGELAAIVERTVGRGAQAIHPATRTFQALRIAVNDELGELERGLDAAECVLNAKGRLAVVSFHSLEDRIVKRFLTERSGRASRGSRHAPHQAPSHEPTFGVSGKQPRMPQPEEVRANPRSRSARLRWAERTTAPCWNDQA